MSKQDIRKLSTDQIKVWLSENGEQGFRAKQISEWLWKKSAWSFDDMTNLSKAFRQQLQADFSLPALQVDATQNSTDGTIKSRFRTFDQHLIEGVLIPTDERKTACVSSQIGCSLS